MDRWQSHLRQIQPYCQCVPALRHPLQQTLPWWLMIATAADSMSALTLACRSLSDCVTKNWNSRVTWSLLSSGDIWLRASATPHRPANESGGASETTRPKMSSTGGATYTTSSSISYITCCSRQRTVSLSLSLYCSPKPVAQCRQFPEEAKDASVLECTWTLSALEALHNALYKFKTYLLTYLLYLVRHVHGAD